MYDYSEEITNYLYKQMSELQREAFEIKLEQDSELAAEVARQQEMLDTVQAITAIKEAQEDPYYDEVDKLTTELLESREKKTRFKIRTRALAVTMLFAKAAAIVLIVLFDMLTWGLTRELDIRKRVLKKYGLRTNITKNLGRKLGRFIAKSLARIRKR